MYLPAHFAETRIEVMQDLIHAHPLASLITLEEEGLCANHIPFIITPPRDNAPYGTLLGHVARANPVWQNQAEVMAIFQGPQAYITPDWYEEKRQNGAVVPTYNYAVVHAHGNLRIIEDQCEFLALLERLTRHFEAPREQPWQVSDAPADYIANLMQMIVGIEIPITRMTGKWKLSQNKSVKNRSNIALGLNDDNKSQSVLLGQMMEQQLFAK